MEDVLILEASANSFTSAERLTALGRQIFILESHRARHEQEPGELP